MSDRELFLNCPRCGLSIRPGVLVIEGENGFLVADETEMADAVKRLGCIDPARCRASVAERYELSVTAAGYEHVYRQAMTADRRLLSRAAQAMRLRLPVPAAPVS
jgi:hypothetical protein